MACTAPCANAKPGVFCYRAWLGAAGVGAAVVVGDVGDVGVDEVFTAGPGGGMAELFVAGAPVDEGLAAALTRAMLDVGAAALAHDAGDLLDGVGELVVLAVVDRIETGHGADTAAWAKSKAGGKSKMHLKLVWGGVTRAIRGVSSRCAQRASRLAQTWKNLSGGGGATR